ncbi:MAG: aldo/keto reductase [Opitutales bacterium]
MKTGSETPALPRRPFGKTGLEVTTLSLGSVFVSSGLGTARETGVSVVRRALDLGINYIDTAPFYSDAQAVVGEALDGIDTDVILGTKCGRWNWREGPYRDLDAFKRQFEQSLKDLRRDRVDIVYVHEADWLPFWSDERPPPQRNIDPDASYAFDDAPVARFLAWLREEKLTRFTGISGNNAHLLAKVLRESDLPVDCLLVAFQYSLLYRNAPARLLDETARRGIGVVLGSPLQQGRLATVHPEWLEEPPDWVERAGLLEDLRTLYAIQRESGLSLAELGTRFLLNDSRFSTLATGPASLEQLEENVACAARGPLPPAIQQRLETLGKVFPGVHEIDY